MSVPIDILPDEVVPSCASDMAQIDARLDLERAFAGESDWTWAIVRRSYIDGYVSIATSTDCDRPRPVG